MEADANRIGREKISVLEDLEKRFFIVESIYNLLPDIDDTLLSQMCEHIMNGKERFPYEGGDLVEPPNSKMERVIYDLSMRIWIEVKQWKSKNKSTN